uniref:Uncharacterized protein n=1 Tax=Trichogramma kaykai TaxID=54128 RepID=A0ABD2W1I3_9HYME
MAISNNDSTDCDDSLIEFIVSTDTATSLTNTEQTDEEKLEKLKSLREELDWEDVKERQSFFHKFQHLIVGWKDHLPDLHDLFEREEMDWMLTECVQCETLVSDPVSFVDFVVRTGYKDEPDLDKDNKPVLHRDTPIHNVYDSCFEDQLIPLLFEIYDSFDVNYISSDGITHFQVAIESGCAEVVEQFLDYGHDPDEILDEESGDRPLHLAVTFEHCDVVRVLLENGADPNLTNKNGMSVLHTATMMHDDGQELAMIFEMIVDICDEIGDQVQIDAMDKHGRTPLQLAVLNRLPEVIDVLLDSGADLSNFVFPSESEFDKSLSACTLKGNGLRLQFAAGALACVERLESRGYTLNRSDAMMIMKSIIDRLLFDTSELLIDETWRDDEDFVKLAKDLKIHPSYTLYDLTRLPAKKPEKPLAYEDYFKLSRASLLWQFPKRPLNACMVHLCEKVSAGFFQRYALEPLMEMMGHEHSMLFCQNVLKKLKNEDLLNVCMAFKEDQVKTNKMKLKYDKVPKQVKSS